LSWVYTPPRGCNLLEFLRGLRSIQFRLMMFIDPTVYTKRLMMFYTNSRISMQVGDSIGTHSTWSYEDKWHVYLGKTNTQDSTASP
ncbi:hypothetical protein MKW98_017570, partial [Papaver atlanticum]